MLCRTWWNRATSLLATVSFMTVDGARSAYVTRIGTDCRRAECSCGHREAVEYAHTVRDSGCCRRNGNNSRCTMRRWSSALTPVLLSPFTWQTEESWRLNSVLPWTCRSSVFTSCREMEFVFGDAMTAEWCGARCWLRREAVLEKASKGSGEG